jgi:hypothetical protein
MSESPLYDQAVRRFLERKVVCAVCGASDWEACGYAVLAADEQGALQPLSRSYAQFAGFTCRDCEQTVFVRIRRAYEH